MEQLNTTTISPHEKAVQINLDKRFLRHLRRNRRGAGSGSLVSFAWAVRPARWPRTISAYDMGFSDAIYGKGERLRQQAAPAQHARLRVQAAHRAPGRKSAARPRPSSPFSDTVSARNYLGTNECHGWLGVKFPVAATGRAERDRHSRQHARQGKTSSNRKRSASSASICAGARFIFTASRKSSSPRCSTASPPRASKST